MALYVIHPGSVKLLRKPYDTVFIDAGTLAAYYGLAPGEYEINVPEQSDKAQHIHLYPRPDGKYRNIKELEGDVPEGEKFYSKSAQAMKRDRLQGMDYNAANYYHP